MHSTFYSKEESVLDNYSLKVAQLSSKFSSALQKFKSVKQVRKPLVENLEDENVDFEATSFETD